MSMWSKFKKWALRGNPLAEPYEHPHSSMVGEPVISFIESLHREGARRYAFSTIELTEYIGKKQLWWGDSCLFFQLIDKKTKSVYQGVIHNNKVYTVVGLPFELNGWELGALFEAYLGYRQAAYDRMHKIQHIRLKREREVAQRLELIQREEYAKRFRENAE